MYKHKLSKSFDYAYGHRVFSQDVVQKYSLSPECPCHRIHGHQGTATIHMKTAELDPRGFVIDFKELSFMKQFLDGNIDHRFIVSKQDPEFERLVGIPVDEIDQHTYPVYLLGDEVEMGSRIKMDTTKPLDTHLDSFLVVDFNPTSEELARWLYKGVSKLIEDSPFECKVDKVVWSETPKTMAEYSE